MIRQKNPTNNKIIIDLNGPEGNAFVLMGYAKKIGKELGLSVQEVDKILKEMREADYKQLLSVFDNYFGEFVILESKNDLKVISKEELETRQLIKKLMSKIGYGG